MALSPSSLALASSCLCFDQETAKKVIIYLLAQNAGLSSMTPSQLASSSSCFCYDNDTWKKVVVFLLSSGGGGTGGGACIVGGVGAPVGVPPCNFSAYIQQPGPNFGLWLGDTVKGWSNVIIQGP